VVVILSLPLTITQRQPGIIRIIPGPFRGALRDIIVHRRTTPRKRRFATGLTLSLVLVTRSIAQPL